MLITRDPIWLVLIVEFSSSCVGRVENAVLICGLTLATILGNCHAPLPHASLIFALMVASFFFHALKRSLPHARFRNLLLGEFRLSMLACFWTALRLMRIRLRPNTGPLAKQALANVLFEPG